MNTQANSSSIEWVRHDGEQMALIVRGSFRSEGIHFFTPGELSQQLAFIKHPKGKHIEAHVHNAVPREVIYTQEVLVIRSGRLRVDFYTSDRQYLDSRVLGAGDVLLLIKGGHGFEVLEEVEMLEIKQGPYLSDRDKTRFDGVEANRIRIKETN
jgi:hypothetical protein